jgi:hypothetical protein
LLEATLEMYRGRLSKSVNTSHTSRALAGISTSTRVWTTPSLISTLTTGSLPAAGVAAHAIPAASASSRNAAILFIVLLL